MTLSQRRSEITPELVSRFAQNGPTDPIAYYRRPLTGRLFRERINLGLRMLHGRRFAHGLEVGYGAGAVLAAIAPSVSALHGIDLDADPVQTTVSLASIGVTASLRAGSVYELPYSAESFDLVVSFSTFEHLHRYDQALSEVRRVLRPGGFFLLGMPAVNRMMEAGFFAIGFRGIDHHHVTTPRQVSARFATHGLVVREHARLQLPLPRGFGVPVYFNWLLERT